MRQVTSSKNHRDTELVFLVGKSTCNSATTTCFCIWDNDSVIKSSTSEREYLSYLLILRHHAFNVSRFRSGYCCTMRNSNELLVQPLPTPTIINNSLQKEEEVSPSFITKSMAPQLVNKLHTFYWTRRSITVLTAALYVSQYCSRWIQLTLSCPTSLRYILILFSFIYT